VQFRGISGKPVGFTLPTGQGGPRSAPSPSIAGGAGSCALAAKQLRAGTYTIVTVYLGNADYRSSQSARKALKAKPGLSDAYQIIAVCSCSLRDVDGANRAYAKLDERSRPLARSLCQKNGIALGDE